MPEQTFRGEWDDTYGMSLGKRVLKAKHMFRVSYRTVLYRLAEPSYIGNDIWPMFQTESKKHTGRTLLQKDEPPRVRMAGRTSRPSS